MGKQPGAHIGPVFGPMTDPKVFAYPDIYTWRVASIVSNERVVVVKSFHSHPSGADARKYKWGFDNCLEERKSELHIVWW